MDPAVLVVLVVAAIPFILWFAYAQAEKWKAALREVARRLGIDFHEGGWFRGSSAFGPLGSANLTIDSFTRSSGKSSTTYTRMRLDFEHTPFAELRREGLLSSMKKAFVGEDLTTGDPSFDSQVVARGDEAQLLALLDHETRDVLVAATGMNARLNNNQVYWERVGQLRDPVELERIARLFAAAVDRITKRINVPRRLLENGANDPVWSVRERNIEVLLERFPQRPEAGEAARLVGSKHSARLQVLAARALGPQAVERLRQMALDPGLDPTARATALEHLATAHAGSAATVDTLRRVTEMRHDPALHVALALLTKLGAAPELGAVVAQADHPLPEARREVARWLGGLGGPEASETLIAMLGREGEEEAALLEVIAGLERVGDRLAVEPLLPLTKGLLTDGDVKRAARAAVAAIQARLGSADGGRLSLAEAGAGGGLALSEEGGGLAVAAADAAAETDAAAEAEAKARS